MQTFLSEWTFKNSARALDNKRLNKQLLEGRQILTRLTGEQAGKGWGNHPAVKQWEGNIPSLYKYLVAIHQECNRRGIRTEKNWAVIAETWEKYKGTAPLPEWWKARSPLKKRVVFTHRARLYEKDPILYKHYEKYVKYKSMTCCPNCTYFWPTHYLRKEMQ